jgi:Flp pilus assembly protein TadG
MPITDLPRHRAGACRQRHQRGSAAVEFALVMIPLLTLLLGSIQFAYWFYSAQSTSSAARETARRLSVGDCQTLAVAQNFANAQAKVQNLTLTYGAPGATDTTVASPGTLPDVSQPLRVVVTANANIIRLFPMPAGGIVTRVVNTRVEDRDAAVAAC